MALFQALSAARKAFEGGERDAEKLKEVMREVFSRFPLVRVQYIEIVHPETLQPVEKIDKKAVALVAAFVGKARLIDNMILEG